MFRWLRIASAVLFCSIFLPAQAVRAPLELRAPVEDKNFYLLSLIERTPPARAAIKSDAELTRLDAQKQEALHRANETCNGEAACLSSALKWTDADVDFAAQRLRALYQTNPALKGLVDGPLTASGMYERYRSGGREALLLDAWRDCAKGINHIIDVFGAGQAPRYKEIDAASYDVTSTAYKRILRLAGSVVEDGSPNLFFQIPLRFGLYLLEANNRDEAGRFEPMEKGENAAAYRRIHSVEWSKFPYSVIVVPGSGGDRPGISISAVGKLRLVLAARRFAAGKAPLILVSGGFVHPNQTPYCEAAEMKKYLIAELKIPADAILIDPHARHTTTNLRNAARLLYRYNVPFDKPGLITTDQEQSRSIEGKGFAERCVREIGYEPCRIGARVSAFDLEFLPLRDSLQSDPMDPLDP